MKLELERRRVVAEGMAQQLGEVPNVIAILVFGSVASGHVDETSDIDILVICEPDIPDAEMRRGTLVGSWTFETRKGDALFPVLEEGISPEGIAMTLHYQRVAWIDAVLEEVLGKGAITTKLLPFRPYTLVGLLNRAWVLEDKLGTVAAWRARTATFPPPLRRNLLAYFVPLLREHTAELLANTRRRLGPVTYIFNLNWAVDAMAGILYALNGIYDPAARRAERTLCPHFEVAPDNFSVRLEAILQGPFDDEAALQKAQRFAELASEVLTLAETS